MVAGMPVVHFKYVKYIRDGMPLFLFNHSSRKLHGIFEAVGKGDLDIEPSAWEAFGSFPAQVSTSS